MVVSATPAQPSYRPSTTQVRHWHCGQKARPAFEAPSPLLLTGIVPRCLFSLVLAPEDQG